MGGKVSISKLGVGLAFLITLAATVFLIPKGNRAGIAGELSPTPSVLPTPSILEQISFGSPRVVLTDTLGFRIVGWISGDDVLIQRDIKPGGHGEAIEIFNVKTGEVGRLVEGRIWGKPIWSPWAKAVAYLLYNEEEEVMELVWQPVGGEAEVIGSGAYQPVVLAPEGKGVMAYSPEEGKLVGKVVTPSEERVELAFSSFAPPAPGCGWKYDTAVSPGGEWQAVYNCEHFLLVDVGRGVIQEVDLGERLGQKRWALDAQWSPDGEKLVIIATIDRLPNSIRFLLLLDPKTERVREISVSRPFVIYHADWAPSGRFLLLSGAIDYKEGFAVVEHRLLDVFTGQERKLNLFPSDPLTGASFAWSPDGRKLMVNCTRPGLSALCTIPVEVRR